MSTISISSPFPGPISALSPVRGEALDPASSPERVVTEPAAVRRSEEDMRLRSGRSDPRPRDDAALRDGFQLGAQAVEWLGREDPALKRRLRAEAAAALARARAMTAAADTPMDQAAFRAEVIEYLKAIYKGDPAFARALRRGTIVVRPATTEDENPELQPEVIHAVYRGGALRAGPPQPGEGMGRSDFVAWWPR